MGFCRACVTRALDTLTYSKLQGRARGTVGGRKDREEAHRRCRLLYFYVFSLHGVLYYSHYFISTVWLTVFIILCVFVSKEDTINIITNI
jgi:hypothetical protein